MSSFSRKDRDDPQAPPSQNARRSNEDLVKDFLRGQNLEQVGKIDEAIALYEQAVEAQFDSSGPYDRLIFIYQGRAQHDEVIRVARASIQSVHTYPQKQAWYQAQIEAAREAKASTPEAI
jgi:tetratricopeptide (TPR) repeat protein